MRPISERIHSTSMNSDGGAKQSDRESSNINTIIANYVATGVLGRVSEQQPLFGDFSGPTDLQTQLHRVQDAQAAFSALPAAVRKAAKNDPVQFLALFETEDGRTLLTEHGLVVVDQADSPSMPPEPPPETPPETPPAKPEPS